MLTMIHNHKIEYHWEDGTERQLSRDAVGSIINALKSKHVKGSFKQDGYFCEWKDITDDDILMFGFTQGWFQ